MRDFSDSSGEEYIPAENKQLSSSDTSTEKEQELINKKLNRKGKVANVQNWKINVNKKKKVSGLAYASKKGSLRPAKVPKLIDCSNCCYNCTTNINEENRNEICREYWNLEFCRQKDFILRNVFENNIKRKRVSNENRKHTRHYFLNGFRVCKPFFLKTLSISHGPVENALSNRGDSGMYQNQDKRGSHTPKNKTPDTVLNAIKEHIESFPVMESHYCRTSTKRKYLDPQLSIRKMYDLFKSSLPNPPPFNIPTEIIYRRYFYNNFNLSFFRPKKDNCLTCEKFLKSKTIDEHEYLAHMQRKEEAYTAKEADKKRVSESFVSATFDLQSVLQIPSSDVSQMYYSRKLCAYNLSIYEAAAPNKAFCFTWTELNGQRGSCEIGSALLQWINKLPEAVKEISLFSDTCGGQNRNQFIAALGLFVTQNSSIDILQHNFLESGHSYMEVDSMHSAIETAKKYVAVYTMNDWINIFKTARSNRGRKKNAVPYEVQELRYFDMIDLKSLAKNIIQNKSVNETGDKVNWLKIKCLRYEKMNPNIILYKYNYSENFQKIDVSMSKTRTKSCMQKELKQLYTSEIPISCTKKKI